MKIYRCEICGEAYIGLAKPSHCPFCGAHQNFLIDAAEWSEKNIGISLSEKTKGYLEESLKLEIDNTAFYRCISQTVNDPEISGMFKFLSKVEREHASVIRKLLGQDKKEETNADCLSDIKKDLEETRLREDRAINFYKEIVKGAPEPRIKTVFAALIQIETDHFNLANERLEKLAIKKTF